ncbi:MAG: hypothetical protein H0U74_02310 [Bradymonadaceae bacterium]|nr:hypothetical protein [Lujinxingiaceae bacterium]
MSEQPKSSTRASKLAVLLVLTVITCGVAAWTVVNVSGLNEPDPAMAQDFAKYFQRRCVRDTANEGACRDVIGFHHRRCFKQTSLKESPDSWGSPYVYDRDGYMQCMREHLTSA